MLNFPSIIKQSSPIDILYPTRKITSLPSPLPQPPAVMNLKSFTKGIKTGYTHLLKQHRNFQSLGNLYPHRKYTLPFCEHYRKQVLEHIILNTGTEEDRGSEDRHRSRNRRQIQEAEPTNVFKQKKHPHRV